MVIVVVSGFLGRYLYTQVPSSRAASSSRSSTTSARSRGSATLTVPMAEIDRELAEQRKIAQRVAQPPSVLRALWWLLFQDIGRNPSHPRAAAAGSASSAWTVRPRNDLAPAGGADDRHRAAAGRRAEGGAAANSWKKVHVPFTIILTGLLGGAHLDFVSRAGW
jgi:hypothetical protein